MIWLITVCLSAISKRLVDYPNLWAYCRELYQLERNWCNIDHVKQLYYAGLPELNPGGIIPVGPKIDFEQAHDRESDKFSEIGNLLADCLATQ